MGLQPWFANGSSNAVLKQRDERSIGLLHDEGGAGMPWMMQAAFGVALALVLASGVSHRHAMEHLLLG